MPARRRCRRAATVTRTMPAQCRYKSFINAERAGAVASKRLSMSYTCGEGKAASHSFWRGRLTDLRGGSANVTDRTILTSIGKRIPLKLSMAVAHSYGRESRTNAGAGSANATKTSTPAATDPEQINWSIHTSRTTAFGKLRKSQNSPAPYCNVQRTRIRLVAHRL